MIMKRRTFLRTVVAAMAIPGLPVTAIPEREFSSKLALDSSKIWSQVLFDYTLKDMILINYIVNRGGSIIQIERR